MQNANNPHYVSLRNQAIQEGNLMHQAFDAASRAHDAGDGAEAKRLSNEGHAHQRRREQINDEAADWIFNANNSVQPPGSIDLHGLYVQEAIERVERAVKVRAFTEKALHYILTFERVLSGCAITKHERATRHYRQRHTQYQPYCKDQAGD
jgi:hypothetical protein